MSFIRMKNQAHYFVTSLDNKNNYSTTALKLLPKTQAEHPRVYEVYQIF
jgi:hypothetical protein